MRNFSFSILILFVLGCSSGGGSAGGEPGSVGRYGSFGKPLAGGPKAEDPSYRPRGLELRDFVSGGVAYAPIDISTQTLTLGFDLSTRKVIGTARITFTMQATGRPYLLLDGIVESARLDGETVATKSVESPVGEKVLSFDRKLSVGDEAIVVLEFTIPSDRLAWSADGVAFLTDMSDIGARFFERFGPTSYEDDPYRLSLRLEIVGKESVARHSLFVNGEVTAQDEASWSIEFPKHYTSSSFYVHLTTRALHVRNLDVEGLERSIPVTIYGSDLSRVEEAVKRMPNLMKGIEGDFGPYPHPGFIAYVSKSSGGMEYVGATITSVSALSHELFHSWFARGVMPAEGRSGWIDEGLASWRDRGFPRATSLLTRAPTNFDDPSIFDRNTPSKSYAEGRALMSELDLKFEARGGLRPVLKTLFERYRLALMTSTEFEAALEEVTGSNVSTYFDRYVSGRVVSSPAEDEWDPAHPTPLTEDEVRELR